VEKVEFGHDHDGSNSRPFAASPFKPIELIGAFKGTATPSEPSYPSRSAYVELWHDPDEPKAFFGVKQSGTPLTAPMFLLGERDANTGRVTWHYYNSNHNLEGSLNGETLKLVWKIPEDPLSSTMVLHKTDAPNTTGTFFTFDEWMKARQNAWEKAHPPEPTYKE
jgi:hypothetical protein